jgi:acid phosphatase
MRTRWKILIGVAVVLVILAGAGYALMRPRFQRTPVPQAARQRQKPRQAAVPKFDHIVIIVDENHGLKTMLGNPAAPYFNKIAKQNALAANYYALFHPSLPNYLALTSGTNAGITSDCTPPGGDCLAKVKNIADEIAVSGRSWKTYQENMPAPCTAHNSGEYATKHNPFVYYPDILHNHARCAQSVVPFSQLAHDLSQHQLPDYAFITPKLCHDMHSCPVAAGDHWLQQQVPKILHSYAFTKQNSLLAITFDEAEAHAAANKVSALLIGPHVKRHYVSHQAYSHYSLPRTVEAAWQLKPLTPSGRAASPMGEFFTSRS